VGDARQKGAQQRSLARRVAFANDPLTVMRHVAALLTLGRPNPDAGALAAVDDAVRRASERLTGPARVRRHLVVPETWEPGGEQLTPTAKLRGAPSTPATPTRSPRCRRRSAA
jgi:hypothetical protein